MSTKPRVFARRAAQVLMASAIAGTGILVAASPAAAATLTGVTVVGKSTKVVGPGDTIAIAGTGFTGMVDNASTGVNANGGSCATAAAVGCSQVRFYGLNVGGTAYDSTSGNFTVATRYVVVSDILIYAVVPSMPTALPGAPSAGFGIAGVAVLNGTSLTAPVAFSSTTATAGATHLIYRHPLTASIDATDVKASATGGGTFTVSVTGGVAFATLAQFTASKITALFSVIPAGVDPTDETDYPGPLPTTGSPDVLAAVAFESAGKVRVTVPPGTPAGEDVAVELIHDSIRGVPDYDDLVYAAVINNIETCSSGTGWTHTGPTPLPTPQPNCTGPAAALPIDLTTIYVEIQGKGFTDAADSFVFDGNGDTTSDCTVVSDVLAFCSVLLTDAPTGAVLVTFTPVDPAPTELTVPAVGVTPGAVFLFTDTV